MSDRPFGGKKEEEGTLARSPVKNSVEMCAIYMFSFRMGGGFDM